VLARPVKSNDGSGILSWDEIAPAIHTQSAYYVAPTGLIALEKMPALLAEDHRNARLLAEAVAAVEGVEIDLDAVQTNIVIFHIPKGDAPSIVAALKEHGVRTSALGPRTIRLVTHHDVSRAQCERAARTLQELLQAVPA